MDVIFQLIPPRLAATLLGLAFIYAGWWGSGWAWQEPGRYKDALGDEGVTVETTVWNTREGTSSNSEGESTVVRYVEVQYEYEGQEHQVELVSSGTPFAEAQEDETIPFRLHPSDPEFLVHPDTDPPSVLLRSIPILLAFLVGGLIVLGVIISFF
ncbi:MAG TPA: hypothetical protein VGE07_28175 [Herpetosiphonaceae bacterium]